MTVDRFPSVFRRQRPLPRTSLRPRRKTSATRRGELVILETLEQRLAMTSSAAIGADLVGIMGRDIRFEGLFNQVSQKWFWTNPAAAPSTSAGSAITSVQPSTMQAPSSTGDWIIRLNSDALARARTIADVRSAVDREGFGIELVAGLGQPGLMLVRSHASVTATTDFFRRHAGVAMFERDDSLRTSSSAVVPNDPDFQRLYGLNNLGQTGGIVDADENEAPEELALSGSSIRENMPAGTLIGELHASDPDGDALSYHLVSDNGAIDESIFAIVGNRLLAKRPLDFESSATRTIRVRAADERGASTEAAFTITVIDVNDAPHEIMLSNDSLAENLPAGAVVGSLATADVDRGARHVYRLVAGEGATDNSAFRIIGNQVRAARSFDFETKSTFSIRVRSTDQGGLSVERTFTIRVTDVAEDAAVVRLSRIPGEGYARLVQGGIALQQGQNYRFTIRLAGDVKLHPTDHIPEFWGQGVIFGGQTVRTAFRDGWTTLEASVTAPVSGIFELKLALWSMQELRLTGISLRSLASGAELVRNGSFGEGLRGWYTHGGAAGIVSPVTPPAGSGTPWAVARRPTV